MRLIELVYSLDVSLSILFRPAVDLVSSTPLHFPLEPELVPAASAAGTAGGMAPSLAAPGGGLQGFLFQLHDALRSSDPGNAALRGCGLIRSLAESCLISSGDDILGV